MPSTTLEIKVDSLELGRLYYKACDLDLAIASLERALAEAETAGDFGRWAQLIPLLMRMRSERLEFAELKVLQAKVREAEASGALTMTSAIEYVKGIAILYEGDVDAADACFRRSLKLADTLKDRVQAEFGLAAALSRRGRYDDTLAALARLHALVEGRRDLRDHAIADLQLKAVCLRETGRLAEALGALAGAESLCHADQNLFLLVNSLFLRGTVHQKNGQDAKALEVYDLCESLLRQKDRRHLKLQLDQRRAQIREALNDSRTVRVTEGDRTLLHSPDSGERDCSGQLMLLKLLDFLGTSPGGTRSKEEIVRHLWGEDYHPLRHDNKVYVTIRRLRQLLEKDLEAPRIILKKADGYTFNPEFRYRLQRKSA